MIYEVTHLTRYRYDALVASNACMLRLLPHADAEQKVTDARLEIDPVPAGIVERADFLGNRLHLMRVETPHRELSIRSRSRVSVERPPPPPTSPNWERIVEIASASQDLAAGSPAHMLYAGRLGGIAAEITAYARESFAPGRAIHEAAAELARRIKADFVYDPKATDVATKPEHAFAAKRGVCQDFSHVMIAGLRGLGLPAAYVSGYIRTIPPEGKPRLEGADASHAWVSVWYGDDLGWWGLDPTNAIPAGNDHVVVARGRDYSDVAPVDGVVFSSGDHKLEVSVDVVPMQ